MSTSLIKYQNNMSMQQRNINDYIFTFRNLLKKINADNVILTGTNALKLHGLNMSREANDLDVVIFKPSSYQINFLRYISILSIKDRGNKWHETTGNEKIQDENYPLNNLILKFKKDDLHLDILLSNEEVPDELLFHKFWYSDDYHSTYGKQTAYTNLMLEFKIQNIALNIEAKNYYSVRNQDGLKYYSRIKDMQDLQDLKNSNFNLQCNKTKMPNSHKLYRSRLKKKL